MRRQRSVPIHAQALNILRSYGTNAHLYLPGVGVVNGITAGNWLDSAGTTAATVDNPVGLVIDAAGAVGPEMFGNFTGATVNTGASIVGGSVVMAGVAPGYAAFIDGKPFQSNKTYRLDITFSGVTQNCQILFQGTGVSSPFTGTGTTSYVFNSGTVTSARMQVNNIGGAATNGTVSMVAFELTGIHASQNTTASKPILRSTAGIQSWQFDGADDYLSLGSSVFTDGDDNGFVCAGVKPLTLSGLQAIAAFRGGASGAPTNSANSLFFIDGKPTAFWLSGVEVAIESTIATVGVPIVVSSRKLTNEKSLKVNGVRVATNSTALSSSPISTAAIGSSLSGAGYTPIFPANANIYPVIAIKGTVSDADMLTLEKFVGSLSGVTV